MIAISSYSHDLSKKIFCCLYFYIFLLISYCINHKEQVKVTSLLLMHVSTLDRRNGQFFLYGNLSRASAYSFFEGRDLFHSTDELVITESSRFQPGQFLQRYESYSVCIKIQEKYSVDIRNGLKHFKLQLTQVIQLMMK